MPSDSDPTTLARIAEGMDCRPTTSTQDTAASRTTARNATGKDDLVELLAMLSLPDSEDDLVALLPLLPAPAPEADVPVPDPIGEILMSADAHLAVATSMYRDSYCLDDITEASGVSAAELADALAPAGHTDQGPAPAPVVIDVPVALRPAPVDLSDLDRPVPEMDPVVRERALSMAYGGADYTDAQISEATGLTPDQIRDLISGYEADFDRAASRTGATDRPPAPGAAPIAVPALVAGLPVEELLAWGEQHAARGVQALAARAPARPWSTWPPGTAPTGPWSPPNPRSNGCAGSWPAPNSSCATSRPARPPHSPPPPPPPQSRLRCRTGSGWSNPPTRRTAAGSATGPAPRACTRPTRATAA